ncbi:hypothetical protein CROQUDRAFT_130947 [Cronartium quercuum f. sp. fusiforme G11]|uniref:DH domain-containing protein n=1 Tax=Cronartium quercuum f. sp. fusiforme G11 TaxID=708437 RepID=A0A9P6TFQ5_9BASI|nr:hypothetical protein CROQUDRAFT_130947 [Cronartium quercuum f. sp. fusiforme G11]
MLFLASRSMRTWFDHTPPRFLSRAFNRPRTSPGSVLTYSGLGFGFFSLVPSPESTRAASPHPECRGLLRELCSTEFTFRVPSSHALQYHSDSDNDGFESAEEGDIWPISRNTSTSSLSNSSSLTACEPFPASQFHSTSTTEPVPDPYAPPDFLRPPRSQARPSPLTIATRAEPAKILICFGPNENTAAAPTPFQPPRSISTSRSRRPTVPRPPTMASRNGQLRRNTDMMTRGRLRPRRPLLPAEARRLPSTTCQIDPSLRNTSLRSSRSETHLPNRSASNSPSPVSDFGQSDPELFDVTASWPEPFSAVPVSQPDFHTRSAAPSPCTESDSGTCDPDLTLSPPTIKLEAAKPAKSYGCHAARVGIQRLAQLLSPLTSAPCKQGGKVEVEKLHKPSVTEKTDSDYPKPSAMPKVVGTYDQVQRAAAASWRSTISEREYNRVLISHGPNEIRRQQIFWELITTEIDLIEDLRKILKLFATPLRQVWDGGWMSGVPSSISELFDGLASILEFHEQFHSALIQVVDATPTPPILKLAPTLLPLIPHLRVYERYLILFEPVTRLLEFHLSSSPQDSRFGEFLRIQSIALKTVGKLNLVSYLLKPVQRLMKYPLFFRELYEKSPQTHPDHLATLELFKLTDETIREIQSAKAREEEKAVLKSIETQLRGLPAGFVFAASGRRLLVRGASRLTVAHGRLDVSTFQVKIRKRNPSLAPNTFQSIDRPPSQASDSSERSRSSRSMKSAKSAYSSTTTSWTSSSEHADMCGLISPKDANSTTPPHSLTSATSEGSSWSSHRKKINSAYVFVMNDMVVFTEPVRRLRKRPLYRVLDEIGIARVIRVSSLVTDACTHFGEDFMYQPHLELELEPMHPATSSLNSRRDNSSPMIVYLTLSEPHLLPSWSQALQSSISGQPLELQSVYDRERLAHHPSPAVHQNPIRQLRGRARSLFSLSGGGSTKSRDSHYSVTSPPPPVPPLPPLQVIHSFFGGKIVLAATLFLLSWVEKEHMVLT